MLRLRGTNCVLRGLVCVCIFAILRIAQYSSHLLNVKEDLKLSRKEESEWNFHGLDLTPNVIVDHDFCPLPSVVQNGQPWPQCAENVHWLSEFWESHPCYAMEGVNGSVCSFLEYLSTKERVCPPTHTLPTQPQPVPTEQIKSPRPNLQLLLDELSTVSDFAWIENRIAAMQDMWVNSTQRIFETKFNGKALQKKSIHLHLGLMELGMGQEAQSGGPLGELVQWSDLIAALYIMGHDLLITHTKRELIYVYTEYIFASATSGCALPPGPELLKFDLIYTDIIGYKAISKLIPKFHSIKCRFRILDSFGTEAQFNVDPFDENNPFGGLQLILGQFNTMYPHSPDNTFLGFVVESAPIHIGRYSEDRRQIALVYGKDGSFWKGKRRYLEIIKEYVPEIHATVTGDLTDVPDFVVNHGVLPLSELHGLLRRTRLFIGLGFPFEGPAPLEAIAQGAVFLNPKFTKPVSKENHEFFRSKPTNRQLTSQNPYAEDYIGEPYAYTVDIAQESDLRKVLEKIAVENSEPYLPYEFSCEGMVERIAFQVEMQNFCARHQFSGDFRHINRTWPPISSLKIVTTGKSCKEVCHEQRLVCEPLFFPAVNTREAFESAGLSCSYVHHAVKPQIAYPAYFSSEKTCCIQTHNLYFSCADEISGFQRLCPCRDFRKGQIALCEGCV